MIDTMSDGLKQRAGIVYQVTESVILGISVCLVAWTADKVISQGQAIASLNSHMTMNQTRIDILERNGSAGLQAHEKSDDERVGAMQKRQDRFDATLQQLQSTPGELKAIGARLDSFYDLLSRMERRLDDRNNGAKPQ